MLTWFKSDASLASRTNDLMKLASSARCGNRRLSATIRSKPSAPRSSARCTVAIPPTPRRSYTRYGPNCSSAAGSAPIIPRMVSVSRKPRECLDLVGRLDVQRQGVNGPFELLGERGHDQAMALDQGFTGEGARDHGRLPVIGGPGEVLEVDLGVGQRGDDLRGDVFGLHDATPSSLPTVAN